MLAILRDLATVVLDDDLPLELLGAASPSSEIALRAGRHCVPADDSDFGDLNLREGGAWSVRASWAGEGGRRFDVPAR